MRLSFLPAFCLILFFPEAHAQIDAQSARDHVIIKYSPLPMFDMDNTIQFGVEVPIGKTGMTIQEDLGYGKSDFSIFYRENNDKPDKTTFKSRTQFRYYFLEKRRVRMYAGAEFLYKRVVYRENQWVGMDCSGFGGCGYFEQKDFKIGRIVGAGHARMGWQFYFSNRLTLDMFTGIGWRSINVRTLTPGLENARVSAFDEFWVSNTPGTHDVVPSLVLGLHLGIVLGKFDK